MHLIKRSILTVIQRPLKSLLILVIMTFLVSSMLSSYIVQDASSNLENSIKNRMGARAKIKTNLDLTSDTINMNPQYKTKHQLGIDELLNVLGTVNKFEEVIDTNYAISSMAQTHVYFNVSDSLLSCGEMGSRWQPPYCSGMSMVGINNSRILDFDLFDYELLEGRMITQEEIDDGSKVIVIDPSKLEHGPQNPVKIGDTITYTAEVRSEQDSYLVEDPTSPYTKVEIDLEVIGFMYNPNQIEEPQMMDLHKPAFVSINLFMDTFKEIEKQADLLMDQTKEYYPTPMNYLVDNMFYLKNFDIIDGFKQNLELELQKTRLIDFDTRVVTSSDEYNSISGPVNNMKKISSILFVGSITASLLIIGLTLLLFIMDRKHEIGIYLALGESHFKVTMQIVMEILFISTIAISLSILMSERVSSELSNKMILNQMNSVSEVVVDPLGFNEEVNILNEYSIHLDSDDQLRVGIMAMSIIAIAMVPTTLYIRKTNPKKILM